MRVRRTLSFLLVSLVPVYWLTASSAEAQSDCRLRGGALTNNVSVRDADGREFVVSVSAPQWDVRLQGRQASVEVESFLSFEGSVSTDALDIRIREPSTVAGVVVLGSRGDARVAEPVARGRRVRARVQFGQLSVDSTLTCDSLMLVNSGQLDSYERGYEGTPIPHHYTECAANPEFANAAWDDGRRDALAQVPEDPSPALASWVPRAAFLNIRPRPTSGRAVRVDLPTTIVLSEVDRNGASVHVEYRWGHSALRGWVDQRQLAPAPSHSGYGRAAGGFRGRAAPGQRIRFGHGSERVHALLRIGAFVYASPMASSAWAQVRELGGVTAVIEGEWAKLVHVPSMRIEEEVMWVRVADLSLQRQHIQGLSVAEWTIEPSDAKSLIVMEVLAGSRAARVGLQSGDIVRAPRNQRLSTLMDLPVRVMRGALPLRLVDPCINELDFQRARRE